LLSPLRRSARPILRGALALLGVRVQTTDLASPWQNGAIERLFGTLKRDLARVCEGDLTQLLIEWRWYYNFARPHQRLNGRTPAEAWHRLKKQTGRGVAVNLWSGNLRGWYFGPS
jgi:putative transposase